MYLFSSANLYFARRPEVSKFPFEIIQRICLEANKDMYLCNKCHNYMEFICNICHECCHCKNGNVTNGKYLCNDHQNYFCKYEGCNRVIPSEYRQNHLNLCVKHETKCFKCGNNFSNSFTLKNHLLNYHKITLLLH